ncbi:cupredoxin domain-containing protein [Engelhardtia mirabilis]|uniref:Plastocyanin n=1 Tax=Engelhardtia mirabilis TaxID=2528011 RepID=A0A518BR14_9BACT|nr:plastocyanin [Planctomycetes bacterium Pla133]QDV03749.1 plastocyanin [Planctomycetes bacterium Pla86]
MNLRRFLGPLVAVAGLASAATAQTTHVVNLYSNVFLPDDLTIQVGDTVRWEWVTNFHNVVSGTNAGMTGIPDGIFSSGSPVAPPSMFEVTFDQAFLDANPVAGNVYTYYCIVHLPGMVGRVRVETGDGSIGSYGYGLNPTGSLVADGGNATIGNTLTLSLSNPVDALAGPGLGIAFLATAPDVNFPGGTNLPGFGLAPSPVGQIVVSLAAPDPFLVLGPGLWAEGGTVTLSLPIPGDPALIGVKVYCQGALIDTTTADGIGLTNGIELVIG